MTSEPEVGPLPLTRSFCASRCASPIVIGLPFTRLSTLWMKALVDMPVILGVNGTGGAIEGYCAAFIVEQRIFADVGFEPVERHDIAGGGYPERQVGIAETGKIGKFQNRFVRHLGRIAMSGIIHDEGSRSLLLFDDFSIASG